MTPQSSSLTFQRIRPWLLATLGGVFGFLGFAGFGIFPFAFIAFVPLFLAIDETLEMRGRSFWLSLWFGFVTNWGGYYWLVEMLRTFSGFGMPLCIFFASLIIALTSGGFALFGWIWARARTRGGNATLMACAALLASELVYPMLFPFYYGASFHNVSILMQVADLGGPLLVTAFSVLASGAIFEILISLRKKSPIPRLGPVAAAAYFILAISYGAFRLMTPIHDTVPLRIALIQANMGILEKRLRPFEGDRRYLEQSFDMEEHEHPDLLVWPESAFAHFLPAHFTNSKRAVTGGIETPVIFGALQRRIEHGETNAYNTAFSVDANGDVLGQYDKNYLLAFGEYLPFADVFPQLYDLSPHSGHFTAGHALSALPYRHHGQALTFGPLICYEDILPSFVRKLVRETHPQVLVNMTNDAWFGDTHEPWIHFALAQFRAIEHRLPLVRATNSGVSGFVDANGRVTKQSGVFKRENILDTVQVPRHPTRTLYALLGDWPGYLALIASVFFAFVRKPTSN